MIVFLDKWHLSCTNQTILKLNLPLFGNMLSALREVVFVAYFGDFGLVGDSAQPEAYWLLTFLFMLYD